MEEKTGLSPQDDRWDLIDTLFHQAIELPANEVTDFCRQACGEDKELYKLLIT